MPLIIRTTGVEDFLDAAGESHIKALIMGEPSAGKTRSASFWPAPIFADCENGRMSLADRRVPYAAIKSSADMDALLTQLEAHCKTTPAAKREYKTFVLDTLDAYQRIVIQEILKAGRKEAMSGWQDWGQLDAKMTSLVARLQKLPMNIIVNLHLKQRQDGDDGPLVYEPKLKGDMRDQITAEFDLVGHMSSYWQSENGQRVLKRAIKWHPDPAFPVLKDRSGQLPQFTEVTFTDQDYVGLFESMFGDYLDTLAPAETLDEITTPEDAAVEEPRAGGPVKQAASAKVAGTDTVPVREEAKPRKAAVPPSKRVPASKSAAAKPAAAPAPEPEPATPEPAPEPEEPAAPVEEPEAEPEPEPAPPAEPAKAKKRTPPPAEFTPPAEPTAEEAQATVEQQLGGKVVAEETKADPEKTGKPPIPCGTPARNNEKPVEGCGKDVNSFGNPDIVNIGLIKTRTYLCPDCLKKWRDANK